MNYIQLNNTFKRHNVSYKFLEIEDGYVIVNLNQLCRNNHYSITITNKVKKFVYETDKTIWIDGCPEIVAATKNLNIENVISIEITEEILIPFPINTKCRDGAEIFVWQEGWLKGVSDKGKISFTEKQLLDGMQLVYDWIIRIGSSVIDSDICMTAKSLESVKQRYLASLKQRVYITLDDNNNLLSAYFN